MSKYYTVVYNNGDVETHLLQLNSDRPGSATAKLLKELHNRGIVQIEEAHNVEKAPLPEVEAKEYRLPRF